ncbi:LAO/AO transport system kinase [Desulfitispora alkaliphila]|uniref:methylmalonyl Co-A mutase-associated GTPase MeaB n=1 Tax=Desulfitispora alkaliphila TaxID=622674 RepID=UPI003D1F3EB2
MDNHVEGIIKGQKRSIAKAITIVENGEENKYKLLSQIYDHTGKALIIGITGSPGAGKSSLTDALIRAIRADGKTVGVVAVDPSSPFSGGALLGDRIRMQEHALDDGVYIRSMGTRGSLGGLARSTKEVLRVIDAAGFDVIIVETVGVGQSELDIMTIADTTIVVLTPAGGDHVQTIKAGIMEIGDVFVINKADLPGVKKTKMEVNSMLDLSTFEDGWRPPVIPTISVREEGIQELWNTIEEHSQHLKDRGLFTTERERKLSRELLEIVELELKDQIHDLVRNNEKVKAVVEQVVKREVNPYTATADIFKVGLGRKVSFTLD